MSNFYTSISSSYSDLLVTGFDGQKRYTKKIPFQPKAYIYDEDGEHRCIDGKPLREIVFDDISSYKSFLWENKDLLKIYGEIKPEYQAMTKWYPDKVPFDKSRIIIAYFDIEVSSIDQNNKYIGFPEATIAPIPIVSVAFFYPAYNEMLVLGLKEYEVKDEHDYRVRYFHCNSEEELLQTLAKIFNSQKYRPDLIYGWNSESFDIPYIINRCKYIFGEEEAKKLSPFGKLKQIKAKKKDVSGQYIDTVKDGIVGIQHVDMMYAYKVFSGREQKESYSLNAIANEEGVGEKLDYGNSRSLFDLFWEDHQRYIDYNMQDTHLLYLIDKKVSLSERLISTAYNNHCNYEDVLGTTLPWDCLIYNEVTKKGLVIPNRENKIKEKYDGGFVRDSKIGKAMWVMTFDYTSLYPSIMMAFNMSYETLLSHKTDNCIVSPNGCFFDKSKDGIICSIVKKIFEERVYHKKMAKQHKDDPELFDYHDVTQYVKKILINSAYGAMGSAGFRYFHTDIAKSITLTGQHLIKQTAETLNNAMIELTGNDKDYLVMGDTDSVAISFEDYVNKNCKNMSTREITEHLVGIWDNIFSLKIREMIEQFYKECNVSEDTIKLNLESITRTAIYCAKKNYIGHIVYNEGTYYDEFTLKVVNDEEEVEIKTKTKGVSGVKSSTPKIFKKWLKEFYKIALIGKNIDAVHMIRKAESEYIKEILEFFGKPIKVKHLRKYGDNKNIYLKGTPFATRGCLVYNHLIKTKKLEAKYDLIRDGDFAHTIRLKQPILGSNYISFPNKTIPKELDLDNLLDFDRMFNNDFLKPINDIMKLIGWSLTPSKPTNIRFRL